MRERERCECDLCGSEATADEPRYAATGPPLPSIYYPTLASPPPSPRVGVPALANCLITSVTSASGQLFIFKTIKDFGPVPFTLIMTIRQILSIIISAALFNHPIR